MADTSTTRGGQRQEGGGQRQEQRESRPAATGRTREGTTEAQHTATASASQGEGGRHENDQGFVERVRERAGSRLEAQKERAVEGLSAVAQSVRRTTDQLRSDRHDTIAEYVDRAVEKLELASARLRDKDIGQLYTDVQRVARRRPMAFVGSAFAIGLVGARFFRSSAPEHGPRSWQHAGMPAAGALQTTQGAGAYGEDIAYSTRTEIAGGVGEATDPLETSRRMPRRSRNGDAR